MGCCAVNYNKCSDESLVVPCQRSVIRPCLFRGSFNEQKVDLIHYATPPGKDFCSKIIRKSLQVGGRHKEGKA